MPDNRDFLIHYGVKGQKWGVRRYQNEDMSLTNEGREHYGIGSGVFRKAKNYNTAYNRTRQAINSAASRVKAKTESKVSEMRGPKHMSDDELNARIKRLRSESEYLRLQREVNGGGNQNGGGGGKKGGDKKHPYLTKAVTMPIAAAIGVGVGAVAKEKVNSFLDHLWFL